jgi:hypothetical protein
MHSSDAYFLKTRSLDKFLPLEDLLLSSTIAELLLREAVILLVHILETPRRVGSLLLTMRTPRNGNQVYSLLWT